MDLSGKCSLRAEYWKWYYSILLMISAFEPSIVEAVCMCRLTSDQWMRLGCTVQMKEYCTDTVQCRHALLLAYFGEHFAAGRCGNCCDNCLARRQGGGAS